MRDTSRDFLRVRDTSTTARRIVDTSPATPRVDPDTVAAALGAEAFGPNDLPEFFVGRRFTPEEAEQIARTAVEFVLQLEIPAPRRPLFVLAHNRQQFLDWARRYGRTPKDAFLIHPFLAPYASGLTQDDLVELPGWSRRPDAHALNHTVLMLFRDVPDLTLREEPGRALSTPID